MPLISPLLHMVLSAASSCIIVFGGIGIFILVLMMDKLRLNWKQLSLNQCFSKYLWRRPSLGFPNPLQTLILHRPPHVSLAITKPVYTSCKETCPLTNALRCHSMSRRCRSFWVLSLNFCTYPALKVRKHLAIRHRPSMVYTLSTTFLNQTVVKVANTGFFIYLFYLVCSTKKSFIKYNTQTVNYTAHWILTNWTQPYN